jgi:hypothetical protein
VSAARQVPDPAAVAWWLDTLRKPQGCIRLAPDPADPPAVAAYDEARRQLAAQAETEVGAGAEPEPAP